jgi:nitrous oxide reductase accessory protein NosL
MRVAAALLVVLLFAVPVMAGSDPAPGPRDKCPVCGMFVAKYPDWIASIQFRDGSRRYFDGVKDLMIFYHGPEKYGFRGGAAAMKTIGVKDYYRLEMIDGRSAWYVIGSDVLGPMGKELIPFARQEDAAEFLRDHRASRILRFKELTPAVLRQLE